MPLPSRALPAGFIAPCLPARPRSHLPAQRGCMRSSTIGFRVIARKEGKRVKLYSRPGNDLTDRFPLIVDALGRLRALLHRRLGARRRKALHPEIPVLPATGTRVALVRQPDQPRKTGF
jgi:hypothetical protein